MDSGLDEKQARELLNRLLVANGCSEWKVYNRFSTTTITAWPDDGDAGIRQQLFLGVTSMTAPAGLLSKGFTTAIRLNAKEAKSPVKSMIENWILDMHFGEVVCLYDRFQRVWKILIDRPVSSIEELEIMVDLLEHTKVEK